MKWISVKEKLPEYVYTYELMGAEHHQSKQLVCLVNLPNTPTWIKIGVYDNGRWLLETSDVEAHKYVSHWFELKDFPDEVCSRSENNNQSYYERNR